MTSFIPWIGGKQKLLWLINKLAPASCTRFVDVFGGSGTVIMNRPYLKGCIEVYNDYNSNLTNLFCCVKDRTLSLLKELGFLPLNARDEFKVLLKFFKRDEFTDDYLDEELELAERYLPPPEAEAIKRLMLERAPRGDIRRAADYFKLIRCSYCGGGKTFAGDVCDIRAFFHLIWKCAQRLANVVVENEDFEQLIKRYDKTTTWFYCDPPYYKAEDCYTVAFSKEDHQRLHDALLRCRGKVMVSYNDCAFIRELYQEFYVFLVKRPNSMSHKKGSQYVELVITNYDPDECAAQIGMFRHVCGRGSHEDVPYELIHKPRAGQPAGNQDEGEL